METKRNKLLWEVISTKMREKGFHRSAEQCKCKWKNLVTRYKGCETVEPEAMRQQFPFYNEMQAIFTARMQRMLWAEAEGGGGAAGPSSTSSSRKAKAQGQSSDEEEEEDSEGERGGGAVKKKTKRTKLSGGGGGGGVGTIREMLEEFMKQQMQMEVQWREAYEVREEERRKAEREWRQRMEALENERLGLERRWREREEQRRVREEARAEKRDALITALLNKLRRDDPNL
ncbi:hypothetical protein Cgig2_021955 [Carnegiea gigantea]|uniref:Myb/SANT-like DNA-binding domain-containing protein n=1 Tax=Carnegiea gigantea TaxID=171969 RepID=A0A9Q1KRZ8_9CARY|nr:hypothetical protein Cgig2_021955 [Carnegiea gigantea]